MKNWLPLILILLSGFSVKGQTKTDVLEGTISYITSRNVYVKFENTEAITIGDTLYISDNGKLLPVMIVKELSSISCVCDPLSTSKLAVNDKISASPKNKKNSAANDVESSAQEIPIVSIDTVTSQKAKTEEIKQRINGRVSVSSYSGFSSESDFSQRMRYSFSINALNIGKSKLSAESYISFVHKKGEWSEIQNDIFNGLKIYSLAANYAFNSKNSLWLGRHINPRLSNVGAIDGLQYETKVKSFTAGIFAGTRPDYLNYSFNSRLLQFGGYVSHDYSNPKGNMQTTLAMAEQKNEGNTDRRFVYLQHSNSLLPKLYFFGSMEFDLFNKEMNVQDSSLSQNNKPNLSNLYISLRYKILKQLSVSFSYSARQNIIYYETYKNIIEQLLDESTLQGYMMQVSYRPFKNFSVGANAGYRFGKADSRATKNLYSYVTYSSIPGIKASATISATLLETGYMNGNIYSLGLQRDLIPGKLSGGAGYRYVKYRFVSAETELKQNMAELNLNWRLMKKLSLSFNYEGTFEKTSNFNRVYINLTQRF